MPRSGRLVALWVFPLVLLAPVILAGVFGYKWLFQDEANRSFSCRGSRGGTATCFEGETVNMLIALGASAGVVVGVAVFVWMVLRWRRADALESRLTATGLRAPGLVTDVHGTGTKINGRVVHKVVMEARIGDGTTLRCTAKTRWPPPEGTRVTLLYDPADPSDVVVEEDLESLADGQWDQRLDAVRDGA